MLRVTGPRPLIQVVKSELTAFPESFLRVRMDARPCLNAIGNGPVVLPGW